MKAATVETTKNEQFVKAMSETAEIKHDVEKQNTEEDKFSFGLIFDDGGGSRPRSVN